jgi:hypothetical protein
MGVRRLTGMNSEAISAETHKVMAKTAPHAAGRQETKWGLETAKTFI